MGSNRIQQIEHYVQKVMSRVIDPDLRIAHDFKHVDRVRGWALQIAAGEGYEAPELVEAAALLHDIGLAHVKQRSQHARKGAEVAAAYLQNQGWFTDAETAAIVEAIGAHSSLGGGGALGDILRDADKLDMFGAVGIMRAFTSNYMKPEYDPANIKGETWALTADDFTARFRSGTGVGDFIVDQINFQRSCHQNLSTQTARQFARPLIEFMRAYILQLEDEIRRACPEQSPRPRGASSQANVNRIQQTE